MQFAKAIVAALVPVVLAAQAALTDSTISVQEWIAIGTAAAGAVAVFLTPNSGGKHAAE